MKRIIVKVNNKIFNFKRNLANINKKSNNCNIKYQKLINFLIFEIIRKIVFHVKLAHLHSPDTKSKFLNKIFCISYNKNLRFCIRRYLSDSKCHDLFDHLFVNLRVTSITLIDFPIERLTHQYSLLTINAINCNSIAHSVSPSIKTDIVINEPIIIENNPL